jgi:hypothetical protein
MKDRPEALRELARFKLACEAQHGPRRTEYAFRLALLAVAHGELVSAVERREAASAAFLDAWAEEDDRAWPFRWRKDASGRLRSVGSRPAWLASTWRASARLAGASAAEREAFDRCGVQLLAAGAAHRPTVPRSVVMYGDDGQPVQLFKDVSEIE